MNKNEVINVITRYFNIINLNPDLLIDEIISLPDEAERNGHFVGIDYDGYADGSPVYDIWQCSECGWIYEGEDPHFNYCPDCGARMDEGSE